MIDNTAFSIHLAIDRHPLTVTAETRVSEVIVLMSQERSSCVLVVQGRKLLGIFTERDVVQLSVGVKPEDTQSFAQLFGECPIAEVMSHKLVTRLESQLQDLKTTLNLMRSHQIRHLPIVDEQDNLVGIITHQSIRKIVKPADWMRLRRVGEVMTPLVISAPESASVLELAGLMSAHDVSCVSIARKIETGNGNPETCSDTGENPPIKIPLGIVTERDILQFQALGLDIAQLQAMEVMSSPVLRVQPTDSLWKAHQLMHQHRVRRLLVIDEAGVWQGIVTQTSLLQGCAPMEMDEAIAALQRLVDERTSELRQANDQLRREILDRKQKEAALKFSQARLAGILDSADDAIISVDETQSIQLFNQGAEKIFGYCAWEVLGQSLAILLPENQREIHRQHIDNFSKTTDKARRMGSRSQVFGRRKDGTTFPAEASISQLEVGSEKIFTVILRDITARVEAQAEIQRQLERERLLAGMRDRIRQSLDLNEILNTTVAEVRQFLTTDRVIIYRFQPDWSGKVVVESVADPAMPLLGLRILDPCFGETHAELYKQGRIKATTDIYNANMSECHINLLVQFQVRANLVVPILFNEDLRITQNFQLLGCDFPQEHSQLWGLLIAHHCTEARHWQTWEMDFLKSLATQVAIAIQQSSLFEQLQAANQQLHQLAALDGLTQVANRRGFDETLNREWRRMAREKAPLSLILCDIDFFKLYNDTYGHQAGDECLQRVAATLKSCVKRPADLVARYGGEEFAIILPRTEAAGALELAQEIRHHVRQLQVPHAQSPISPYVSLSLGVAHTIPRSGTLPNVLLAAADRALYDAKNQGRDRAALHPLPGAAQRKA
ncbi:diguanylate cyclase domain-containing protein [Phormidium sp. CCY1219]|uniref:diguanylate cyclase domain-containing protein n=1 Tax=Phormidium sp. CCY1219 TaxID=2886104 RepID=UPI002D1F8621|nr:diguanylate cyclase [Phormidium sp. CCY1219]MEB3830985.1 diguanylate cyclase [Phormidium sp. CCY1219]